MLLTLQRNGKSKDVSEPVRETNQCQVSFERTLSEEWPMPGFSNGGPFTFSEVNAQMAEEKERERKEKERGGKEK